LLCGFHLSRQTGRTGWDFSKSNTVTVSKSATPDTQAPTCTSFQIVGGAATTSETHVTLTNDAVDLGGSGLLDMKIWNDGESEDSAQWQRYGVSTDWELRHQAGVRTVNVRFRDGAMPGNVRTSTRRPSPWWEARRP
jgi:hypothetical protein